MGIHPYYLACKFPLPIDFVVFDDDDDSDVAAVTAVIVDGDRYP